MTNPHYQPYGDYFQQPTVVQPKKSNKAVIVLLVLILVLLGAGIAIALTFLMRTDETSSRADAVTMDKTITVERDDDTDEQEDENEKERHKDVKRKKMRIARKDDSSEDATNDHARAAKRGRPAAKRSYDAPSSATTGRFFQIPGKNIGCEFKNGVFGCTVEITGSYDCGGGKASFALGTGGVIGHQCGTQYLGQRGDIVPMLYPGTYWTNDYAVCKILSNTRIKCWNSYNGDGFELGDNQYSSARGEG
ncbi:MAG: hypothetical protein Q4P66_04775 [Actinomycetaceae bacterium]|nr:hypothetical protein [Actinomycetaceae bacterium]